MKATGRFALTTIVLVALSTIPSLAHGAPSEGEALFREGRAAMQEKDFDRACEKFAESQKKEPAPGTALNLGDCEEQRGHLVAASEAFAIAASTFSAADKRKYATSRAEAIDRRVPRLTVRASVKVAGLVVRSGDKTLSVDVEIKLDPGDVVLRAEAPEHRSKDLRVKLREGKSHEVDVGSLDLEAKPVSTGATPAVEKSPPRKPSPPLGLRTVGLVVGAVGVASLAVGGVTGLLALGRASTVKDHCDDNLACDSEGVSAAKSGDTLSLVSTITFATGGAAVAGGALLYFLAPKATKKAIVSPSAFREGAGLTVLGTF